MRGLDPRIHPRIELRFRAMDCRIKPGNDAHAAHRNSYSTVKQQASHASAFSRRDAPELCVDCRPLKEEGAGKAGCALHPRSRVQTCTKKRTRAYRFSGGIPAFPARWFTAYFELSPVNGLHATVAPEKLCFSRT